MDDLKTWLDARGISSDDAAKLFGVEPQTIRNWRSSGVPERRRLHVEAVMANHGKAGEPGPRMLTEITIRPSLPQLQSWHNAAQSQGKDLETWTIDGLDQLAAEAENLPHAGGQPETASPHAPESNVMAG